jgi:hypothetical protein
MNKENINKLVRFIISEKAGGNSFQEMNISMKLMLKGIPAKKIMEGTDYPEDPKLLEKIYQAAKELNIVLPKLTEQ